MGSQRKLEALKRGFSGPLFVIDRNGRYRDVTGGDDTGDLLYADPDTLEGQRFHDLFNDALADRFLSTVQTALETNTTQMLEYELSVPAGDRWFEATVAPIPPVDDPPEAVLWAARDVTDRKRHERAVTELHQTAIALHTSDSKRRICQQTITAAESLLEFDQSVIALEQDGNLQIQATSEALADDATRTLSADEGIAGKTFQEGKTFRIDDLDNAEEAVTPTPFRSCLSLPIGEHGNFQAVDEAPGAFDEADQELAELLIAQTQAALTRLDHQAEVRRRNERLEEFASIVSHDLQTPLAVATGRLELARQDCDSEHLGEVRQALDRMETMIDDLLALAKSGGAALEVEPVDLGAVVERCWESVAPAAATLTLETGAPIMADETGLRQVVENLVTNALDHGGTEIRVGQTDEGFYVADNGPGVPVDDRAAVFEAGHSGGEEGAGFGLRIVKRVVEAHDWAIEVSDSVDGGARFEVTGVEVAAE